MTRIEKWQIYLVLKSNQSLEVRLKDSTQHFDLHVCDDPGGYLLTHAKCHPNQYFNKKKWKNRSFRIDVLMPGDAQNAKCCTIYHRPTVYANLNGAMLI